MNHCFSNLQNGAGTFMSNFFLAALAFCFSQLHAQTIDVNLIYDHTGSEIGDTVGMSVTADAGNPIIGFTAVFEVDTSKYDFSSVAGTLVDSWLGSCSDLNSSVSFSGDELTVTVERIDRTTRTGTGTVMTLGGIVIIDDIHTKVRGLRLQALEGIFPVVQVGPNPSRGHVWLQGWSEDVIRMELVTGTGQVLALPLQEHLDLSELDAGSYCLRLSYRNGRVSRHRIQLLH